MSCNKDVCGGDTGILTCIKVSDTGNMDNVIVESVLVMSGPVSRPHEGHYDMSAILEPDMCIRYIRE